MAIPTKDPDLVSFGSNFSTRITASPTTFGLSASDATQYSTVLGLYVSAYNAAKTARDGGDRSKSLNTAKDTAKGNFLAYARDLYGSVQADSTVSDANKNLLGVTVRARPTPNPIPSAAPQVDIVSVRGKTVSIRIHDAAGEGKRSRPAFVKGAAICSFVGPSAPTDPSLYKWEGSTTRPLADIVFPDSTAPVALVWITAMWFNNKQQNGPACTPISANLQFGGLSQAA